MASSCVGLPSLRLRDDRQPHDSLFFSGSSVRWGTEQSPSTASGGLESQRYDEPVCAPRTSAVQLGLLSLVVLLSPSASFSVSPSAAASASLCALSTGRDLESKFVTVSAPRTGRYQWSRTCKPQPGSKRGTNSCQRGLYAGPNARKEAEETERTRWIEVLAAMLTRTSTPMGTLLASQPSNMQLLGAGKRASTLRSRVRAVKRFLERLALTSGKGYAGTHRLASLSRAHGEPCRVHTKALVFLEEVAGVTSEEKAPPRQSTLSSRRSSSPVLFLHAHRSMLRSACSRHSSS